VKSSTTHLQPLHSGSRFSRLPDLARQIVHISSELVSGPIRAGFEPFSRQPFFTSYYCCPGILWVIQLFGMSIFSRNLRGFFAFGRELLTPQVITQLELNY